MSIDKQVAIQIIKEGKVEYTRFIGSTYNRCTQCDGHIDIKKEDQIVHVASEAIEYIEIIEGSIHIEERDEPDAIFVWFETDTHSTTCDWCGKKGPIVYADQYEQDFDPAIADRFFSHGVAAYVKGDPIHHAQIIIDYIEHGVSTIFDRPYVQICCSHEDEHIGDYGIYVKGIVHIVASEDIHSFIDEEGRRFFRRHRFEEVKTIEEYDEWSYGHKEIIVDPKEIVGVWVKKESQDFETIAPKFKAIADKIGIPYEEIWEDYPRD